MQNHPGDEAVAELIFQPRQVASRVTTGPTVGLDLDTDDSLAAELGDEVHLAAPLFLAQVEEAWPGFGNDRLNPELCGDERVEDPPEEIAVAHYGVGVDAQDASQERGVNEIAL